jgi:hypothetical protein
MELVQARDESPAREFAVTRPDLAATPYDGRQVVGRQRDGRWTICVYASAGDDRLLGYATARTRLSALQHAGLSGDDAVEVLGRAGI